MRRLLRFLVVLAVLWSAWWAVAAFGLRGGVTAWFEARAAEGWQAEMTGADVAGYPARAQVTLRDVALADPQTGVAVSFDALQIAARTLWPGDVTVTMPETPVRFATPEGRAALIMEGGVITLELAAERSLGLERLEGTAGAWHLNGAEGSILNAQNLKLAMKLLMTRGEAEARYAFDLNASGFTPGDVPRAILRVPEAWPLAFDAMTLQAEVGFDRPWNIRALDDRRPQPRRIDLTKAEARWGDLRLKVAAELDVDSEGIPSGTINLQAEQWPVMLDLAVNAGVLPAGARDQTATALRRLASLSGNPETLDIQLNLAGGFMAVGFIPIGRAPRIILR